LDTKSNYVVFRHRLCFPFEPSADRAAGVGGVGQPRAGS
jgi:hypothetical protein